MVAIDAPEFLEAVRTAAEHDQRLEIDYWSAGRDELTTRRIDPTAVFFALGEWYVDAYCHRAAGDRLFRVDRIRGVRPTGEHFEPSPAASAPGVRATRRKPAARSGASPPGNGPERACGRLRASPMEMRSERR